MIGKLMVNDSFAATFGYCFDKAEAVVLGGNVAPWMNRVDMTSRQAEDFISATSQIYDLSRSQNRRVKRPVYHIALSLPYEDSLTDEQWSDLGDRYLAGLILSSREPSLLETPEQMHSRMNRFIEDELPQYQYAIVQHNDQEHRHVHLVCSRINLETGKAINRDFDHYRSQKIIRLLEAHYGLQAQPNSWEVGRKSKTKNQILKEKVTGIVCVQSRLQDLLEKCAGDRPSMPVLIERLQNRGVEVNVQFTRTGQPKGISYALDGVAIAGYQLGNRYSFNGLQQLGVKFKPEEKEIVEVYIRLTPKQRRQVEKIAPAMQRILQMAGRDTVAFKNHTLTLKQGKLTFKAHRGEKPVIAQAVWTDGRWNARENAFTPELLKQWQELKQRIEQQEKQVQER